MEPPARASRLTASDLAIEIRTYRALLAPRVVGADDALDAIDLLPELTIHVASIFE